MHERLEVGGERWEELVFLIFHIQPLSFNKNVDIAQAIPGPTEKSEFYDTGTKSVSSWLTVQS